MQAHEESTPRKNERPLTEVSERPYHGAEESKLSEEKDTDADSRNHEHIPTQAELIARHAREYAALEHMRGDLLPVLSRKKATALPEWSTRALGLDVVLDGLRRGQDNLGVRTRRMIDLDLDSPEARAFVTFMHAKNAGTAAFGHSEQITHLLFAVEGHALDHHDLTDPTFSGKGAVLLEIRGHGCYTVLPPSIHEGTGDPIVWIHPPSEILHTSQEHVVQIAHRIAAGALLIRHMPGDGARHPLALWLSGALVKSDWPDDSGEQFIKAVFTLGGASDPDAKVEAYRSTRKQYERGKAVAGVSRLEELLPKAVAQRVIEWLALAGNRSAVDGEHDRPDVLEAVARLNLHHFVTTSGGRTLIATRAQHIVTGEDEWVTSGLADFRARYMNESLPWGRGRKDLGSVWLQHPQRRQFLGGIRMIPEGGAPPDVFNTWTGLAISPKEGVYPRLDYHIREIICAGNAERAEYLLNWFARLLQRPGQVGEVVPVLRGGQGTGKSILAHAIAKMFGRHALPVSKPDHFVGRFNRHLRDVVFLFLDEAFFAGDRSVVGYMKTLITEPTLLIEAKGVDAEVHRNRLSIMIASNSDQVIAAAADERRYAVFEVSSAKQRDEAYFTKLVKAIHHDGELEAFAFEMLRRPIESFNPQRIPSSAGLFQQKVLGDSILRAVFQILEEQVLDAEIDPSGDIWFGMTHGKGPGWMPVMKRALYAQAKERHHGNRNYFDAEETFGKRLKELLGDAVQLGHKASYPVRREQVRSRTVGEGETVEYNLRDFDWERRTVYRFAPLEECRRAFERAVNHSAAEIGWSEVDRSPERHAIAAEHAEAFLNKRFRSEHLATEEEQAERGLRDAAF